MRIISINFTANTPSWDGPGQNLSSAHVDEGFTIEADGAFYIVSHALRWGAGKFVRIHADRATGAMCIADEDVKKGGKK